MLETKIKIRLCLHIKVDCKQGWNLIAYVYIIEVELGNARKKRQDSRISTKELLMVQIIKEIVDYNPTVCVPHSVDHTLHYDCSIRFCILSESWIPI